jgi:peptidyl-prolyl cis-trans isomerase B (cyclophilin B)
MARLAAQQRRRRRVQAAIGGALALVVLGLGTTWLLGGFSGSSGESVTLPTCTWTPRDITTGVEDTGLPPTDVPTEGVQNLVISTNLGEIRAIIDVHSAFCGAASVGFLAGSGFYNGTKCHALDTTLYVLTCGSKTGDSTSSPGYQFPNEGLPRQPLGTASPAPDVSATPDADPNSYYAKGAVLLSNIDVNATGSQLIFVYQDGTALPPDYTQIGEVSTGLDLIQKIADGGAVNTDGAAVSVGAPKLDLTFSSVQVSDELSTELPSGEPPTSPASGEATPTTTGGS